MTKGIKIFYHCSLRDSGIVERHDELHDRRNGGQR